jgi:hypothetical protein
MASCTVYLIFGRRCPAMHLAPPSLTIAACTYPYPQTVPPDLAGHPDEQSTMTSITLSSPPLGRDHEYSFEGFGPFTCRLQAVHQASFPSRIFGFQSKHISLARGKKQPAAHHHPSEVDSELDTTHPATAKQDANVTNERLAVYVL